MKKAFWLSRYPLDNKARNIFCWISEIQQKEVLWPSDEEDALNLAKELLETGRVILGIFPAQAIEAMIRIGRARGIAGRVFSPVSIPKKKRDEFEFVRWARII